jgi:hypothetical protein
VVHARARQLPQRRLALFRQLFLSIVDCTALARDPSEAGQPEEHAGAILLHCRSKPLGMTAVSDQPKPSHLAVAPELGRRHAETVNAAIVGEADGLEVEAISHSWRRSAEIYQIDAESHEAPRILTESALRLSKEPIECVVRAAQPELDRLHRIVCQAGYVTLLCDTEGVMVDDRGSEERSAELRHWGIWVGRMWSEATEGTNGIGTCIADRRAVTVHQTQHFRSRHIGRRRDPGIARRISRYHFIRAFKAGVGMPPHRYVLEQRVRKAAELIERSEQPLTRIALNLGFADRSHFSRSFHALVGLTPSQFRRAHR